MKVFRLCNKDEIDIIAESKSMKEVGKEYQTDSTKSTHQYEQGKKYMHFFNDEMSILFLNPKIGKFMCVYDIPEDVLNKHKGSGNYADFINFTTIINIPEFAIPSELIKLNYLKSIYMINEDIDFDYYPTKNEFYSCLKCISDSSRVQKKFDEEEIEH